MRVTRRLFSINPLVKGKKIQGTRKKGKRSIKREDFKRGFSGGKSVVNQGSRKGGERKARAKGRKQSTLKKENVNLPSNIEGVLLEIRGLVIKALRVEGRAEGRRRGDSGRKYRGYDFCDRIDRKIQGGEKKKVSFGDQLKKLLRKVQKKQQKRTNRETYLTWSCDEKNKPV